MLIEQLKAQEDLTSIECSIAEYFLEAGEALREQSARSIAVELYTAPSTISRFCKCLGYSGYNEFRNTYLDELRYRSTAFADIDANQPFRSGDDPRTIVDKVGALYRETVTDTLTLVENESLGKAVDLLASARTTVVYSAGTQAFLALDSADEGIRARAAYHEFVASAMAVKLAHEIDPENKVGLMYNGHLSYPASCNPSDVIGTMKFEHLMLYYCDVMCHGRYPGYKLRQFEREGIELPVVPSDEAILAEGTVDFVSFSYYLTHVTGEKTGGILKGLQGIQTGYDNPYLAKSEWGWGVDPQGLRYICNQLYDRYQLPVMVVENGLGAVDEVVVEDGIERIHDPYRVDYLRKHLDQLRLAIEEDGVDVMGYTCWGPIDIIAASTGEMAKRYGFIYVDVDDEGKGSFRRIKKDSFAWYQQVCQTNGANL